MVLPNFLIVGAAKSGTTSLSHYLRQHPAIFVAREKEMHYFAHEELSERLSGPGDDEGLGSLLVSDLATYEECFAPANGAVLRGESSVYYCAHPDALRRALDLVPEMRFIFLMRRPVDRCVSAFSHMKRDGREPLGLREALHEERQRVEAGWSPSFWYAGMSDYPAQIARMQEVVGEDRLHLVVMEELLGDDLAAINTLVRGLGLHPYEFDTSLALNKSGVPRYRFVNRILVRDNSFKRAAKRVVPHHLGTVLAERIRARNLTPLDYEFPDELRAVFDEHMRGTEALLGRGIEAWRTAPQPA
jgi:hypothetical protein